MENETKTLEEVVSTPPVAAETTQTSAPVTPDLTSQAVAVAEAAIEKLKKVESDRDNYKEGMLAKERKLKELKDQGYEIGDQEERLTLADVNRLVEEKLSQVKKEETSSEVGSLYKQVSELKTALVNRQGLPTTPTGNGTETQEPKAARWVDEPATAERLKSQGLDPNKVYENWKANQPN